MRARGAPRGRPSRLDPARCAALFAASATCLALLAASVTSRAQGTAGAPPSASPSPTGSPSETALPCERPAPPVELRPAAPRWSFESSTYLYLVPDQPDYVQPTVSVDHRRLHMEARYNYEDIGAGSFWLGVNFSVGKKVTFDVTPIVGGVFGSLDGLAPGLAWTLAWRWLELSSESEYVFDLGGLPGNFLYTWSELSASPTDWLRLGFVVQRTRAFHTDLQAQAGVLLGLSYRQVELTGHVFNLGWDGTVVVISLVIHQDW